MKKFIPNSLDIRDHDLLIGGVPEETFVPSVLPPLPPQDPGESESQIEGGIQIGICGRSTVSTSELFPLPVLTVGPTTDVAPTTRECRVQPDRPDTGSGTGSFQSTDDAAVGPSILLARTNSIASDILKILDVDLQDSIEVQPLDTPVDKGFPLNLGSLEALGSGLPAGQSRHDLGEGPSVPVGDLRLSIGAVEHLSDPDVDPEDSPGVPLRDLWHLQGEVNEPPGEPDRVEELSTPLQQGVEVFGPPQRQEDLPSTGGVDGDPTLEGSLIVSIDGEALRTQLRLNGGDLRSCSLQLLDLIGDLLDRLVLLQEPFSMVLRLLQLVPDGTDDAGSLFPTTLDHPGGEPRILDPGGDLLWKETGDVIEIPDDVDQALTDPLEFRDQLGEILPPSPVGEGDGELRREDVSNLPGHLPSPFDLLDVKRFSISQ